MIKKLTEKELLENIKMAQTGNLEERKKAIEFILKETEHATTFKKNYFKMYGLPEADRIVISDEDMAQDVTLNLINAIDNFEIKSEYLELSDTDFKKQFLAYALKYVTRGMTAAISELSRNGFTTRYYMSLLLRMKRYDRNAVGNNDYDLIAKCLDCSLVTSRNLCKVYHSKFEIFEDKIMKEYEKKMQREDNVDYISSQKECVNEFISSLSSDELELMDFIVCYYNEVCNDSKMNWKMVFANIAEELNASPEYISSLKRSIKDKAINFFNMEKYKKTGEIVKLTDIEKCKWLHRKTKAKEKYPLTDSLLEELKKSECDTDNDSINQEDFIEISYNEELNAKIFNFD